MGQMEINADYIRAMKTGTQQRQPQTRLHFNGGLYITMSMSI